MKEVSERDRDEARARALAPYRIIDTDREADFDDIVEVAAAVCGMPISLVSLLDGDRQWFKAETGLGGVRETPIGSSICAQAVRQDGLFIIPDASVDVRTASNPLVTGAPHVRFYAGMPISTNEGVAIGTLCVLDTQPRVLTPIQAATLKTLARQVMVQLELRRALRERRDLDRRNAAILDSAVDYAIVAMDLAGTITTWRGGAPAILGWSEQEIVGRPIHTIFTAQDVADGIPEREMEAARTNGRGNDERWHIRKGGDVFWASGEMMPLLDARGHVEGLIKILRDRTAQRAAAAKRKADADFLDRVLESSNDAIQLLDLDATPIFSNAAGRLLTPGLRQGETTWPDVWHLDHRPAARAALDVAAQGGLGRFQGVTSEEGGPQRWWDVQVTSVVGVEGSITRLLVVSRDVTQAKNAEARRLGLIELGDQLRRHETTAGIAYAAADVLGRTLGITRAGYGIVDVRRETVLVERDWTAPGVASVAGSHRFRDYGSWIEQLKAGQNVLMPDVAADARTSVDAQPLRVLDVAALVSIPLLDHGVLVAVFFLHHRFPRQFSDEEVGFARNVADRAWAAIARREAEDRQHLLNQELGHRLKNILSMVQAIAAQTLRTAPDMATAQRSLTERMITLGTAHDLLLQGRREAADLGDLVRGTVGVHETTMGSRFHLHGPDVTVGSRAALALSLMMHELATNAVKFGALSVPSGSVDICWSLPSEGDESLLHLEWIERGGPPVAPPARRGFGSRLIERSFSGQIGGSVVLSYPPEGVRCILSSPLLAFQNNEAHPASEPYGTAKG